MNADERRSMRGGRARRSPRRPFGPLDEDGTTGETPVPRLSIDNHLTNGGGVARIDVFFSGWRNGGGELPREVAKSFLVFAGSATATRNLWWAGEVWRGWFYRDAASRGRGLLRGRRRELVEANQIAGVALMGCGRIL